MLPVDQEWGVCRPQDSGTPLEWLIRHCNRLKNAYRQQQDQNRRNRGAKATALLLGERVLIRNFRGCARGKLGPHWDPQPFVVLMQPSPGQPTYVVRPEEEMGQPAPFIATMYNRTSDRRRKGLTRSRVWWRVVMVMRLVTLGWAGGWFFRQTGLSRGS